MRNLRRHARIITASLSVSALVVASTAFQAQAMIIISPEDSAPYTTLPFQPNASLTNQNLQALTPDDVNEIIGDPFEVAAGPGESVEKVGALATYEPFILESNDI